MFASLNLDVLNNNPAGVFPEFVDFYFESDPAEPLGRVVLVRIRDVELECVNPWAGT